MMGGYSKHVGLIDLNARGRTRRGIMIAVGQEVQRKKYGLLPSYTVHHRGFSHSYVIIYRSLVPRKISMQVK